MELFRVVVKSELFISPRKKIQGLRYDEVWHRPYHMSYLPMSSFSFPIFDFAHSPTREPNVTQGLNLLWNRLPTSQVHTIKKTTVLLYGTSEVH
jgi:hypothetical protein